MSAQVGARRPAESSTRFTGGKTEAQGGTSEPRRAKTQSELATVSPARGDGGTSPDREQVWGGAQPLETAFKPALLSRKWTKTTDVRSVSVARPRTQSEAPRPPHHGQLPRHLPPLALPNRSRMGRGVWHSDRQAGDASRGEKWGPGSDLAQEMDCLPSPPPPPVQVLSPLRRCTPDCGRIHRLCPLRLSR